MFCLHIQTFTFLFLHIFPPYHPRERKLKDQEKMPKWLPQKGKAGTGRRREIKITFLTEQAGSVGKGLKHLLATEGAALQPGIRKREQGWLSNSLT